MWVSGKSATRSSFTRGIHLFQQIDRGVPQRRQYFRTTPLTHSTRVLAPRHIPHVVQPVLDAPMRTNQFSQPSRTCTLTTQTRDVVRHLHRRLTLDPTFSLHTHDLSQLRPPPMVLGKPRRGRHRPLLDPTVALVRTRRVLQILMPQPTLVGGKKPSRPPRTPPGYLGEVSPDCP